LDALQVTCFKFNFLFITITIQIIIGFLSYPGLSISFHFILSPVSVHCFHNIAPDVSVYGKRLHILFVVFLSFLFVTHVYHINDIMFAWVNYTYLHQMRYQIALVSALKLLSILGHTDPVGDWLNITNMTFKALKFTIMFHFKRELTQYIYFSKWNSTIYHKTIINLSINNVVCFKCHIKIFNIPDIMCLLQYNPLGIALYPFWNGTWS
jgi:hypothetical protein